MQVKGGNLLQSINHRNLFKMLQQIVVFEKIHKKVTSVRAEQQNRSTLTLLESHHHPINSADFKKDIKQYSHSIIW